MATETRHTPGPWRAVDRGVGWEIHHTSDRTLPMGRGDCYCKHEGCRGALPSDMRTDIAYEADARLIAAAPDLLALVQGLEWAGEMQGECEAFEYCLVCGSAPRSGHKDDCELAAAIAKATEGSD